MENIQHTHEPLSYIPSNNAENEEEVGSKTAKEHQGNFRIENNCQAPQNKLAFIVGDSINFIVQNLLKKLQEISIILYLLMKTFFYWVIST